MGWCSGFSEEWRQEDEGDNDTPLDDLETLCHRVCRPKPRASMHSIAFQCKMVELKILISKKFSNKLCGLLLVRCWMNVHLDGWFSFSFQIQLNEGQTVRRITVALTRNSTSSDSNWDWAIVIVDNDVDTTGDMKFNIYFGRRRRRSIKHGGSCCMPSTLAIRNRLAIWRAHRKV